MYLQESFAVHFYDDLTDKALKIIKMNVIPAVGTLVRLTTPDAMFVIERVVMVEHEDRFIIRCILRRLKL